MTQPWRDLPRKELIQAQLAFDETDDTLDVAAKRMVRELCNMIVTYHSIPKDQRESMQSRENQLRVIGSRASTMLQRSMSLKKNRVFAHEVALISDRAKKKAAYLRKLKEFFDSDDGKKVYQGKDLFNFLITPPGDGGELARLQSGCLMERIDPYHRSVELDLLVKNTDGTLADFIVGTFQGGPMAWAFAQWCGLVLGDKRQIKRKMTAGSIRTDTLPPFFLWLENHPICLGDDNEKFGAFDQTPKDVTSVFYSGYGKAAKALARERAKASARQAYQRVEIKAVPEIDWIVPTSSGVVVKVPLENTAETMQLYDTTHLPGKSEEENAAAYAWTQCHTLLVGEHIQGAFHHSSFAGGDEIRCSGMIRVKRGKVDLISSNSGHYRPTEDHLHKFASWLNDRHVFTPTATARFVLDGKFQNQPISQFLNKESQGDGLSIEHVSALDSLNQLMATAAEQYRQSETRDPRFRFFRFMTRSKESKRALQYLSDDFPHDIEVAKINVVRDEWWTIPAQVIRALLNEAGAGSFSDINAMASKLSPTVSHKLGQYSSAISQLRPLKQNSTMHRILSEQWQRWQQRETVLLRIRSIHTKRGPRIGDIS